MAVVLSFLQLTAVGYVIQAIFDSDSLWLVALLLAGMVAVGSLHGPRSRARNTWRARIDRARPCHSTAVTLWLVLALGVFPTPRPATWCRWAGWSSAMR